MGRSGIKSCKLGLVIERQFVYSYFDGCTVPPDICLNESFPMEAEDLQL